MIEGLLTGLRIGGIAIFAWLAWRILFESFDFTKAPKHVRDSAWRYHRVSILVMCFVMCCLASPANIMLANGLISLDVNFAMMSGVTIGACIYAILKHHGLDIATGKRPVHWFACLLIMTLSALYGTGRAL
ncbi:hypothetical protein INR77_08800 [Erythrobacter sp. SCSIO 43205]|uniref:hypothetical protein n=1 Tax=Erythrobacter sp. SCSIO 43205 TaxID=2779361 RepID=UPI001CA8C664|nr:hypothetical protein [Erythrobacter sp. SCSIO 43205]UAB76945.1 hypothetical protein INR77_08800 [Erythrobacter sp. SCSIO 43205]